MQNLQKQMPMEKPIKFDKMLDYIEDIEDILEYCSEIFDVENPTTRELLCNALLHYFYLPIVVGSLNGNVSGNCPEISINTALFILNKTFKMVKF
jgi:hypothetical protein